MKSSAVLPAGVPQLLALFETDLEDVRFPDVDLAHLQQHAARCHEQAGEVAQLEADLAAAQLRAEGGRQELIALATKAVAYAKVFAAEDEALSQKLVALPLDTVAKRRKAGRPRKTRARASRSGAGTAVANAAVASAAVAGESPQRALGLEMAEGSAADAVQEDVVPAASSGPGLQSGSDSAAFDDSGSSEHAAAE